MVSRLAVITPTFLSIFFYIYTSSFFGGVHAFTSYANDWVDPEFIVNNLTSYTSAAQASIIDAADELALYGPWSVMNKTYSPPTGDKHDYMSWAPYSWPNCTGVGNTSALTDEEIWSTCPYYTRDGVFNPDVREVNDVGAFQNLSDAVLYNAISWAIQGSQGSSSSYSQNIVNWINTWFLNADTLMNPNLDYAQMARGPSGQVGQHTGVLDLKSMVKVVSGILILKKGSCPDWTTDIDTGFSNWTASYISWLETASIALREAAATNNHGSFYYNQLASLKIIVGDTAGAANVTQTYFNGIYMGQIDSDGKQPLELARTRPYHYTAYNLAAMITNARLDAYVNSSSTAWNKTTTEGATIKTALDYAITVSPGSSETAYVAELYPPVAAVAATYGDSDSTYANFLKNADTGYIEEPYFVWDQPFSDSGLVATTSSSASTAASTKDSSSGPRISTDSVAKSLLAIVGVGLAML